MHVGRGGMSGRMVGGGSLDDVHFKHKYRRWKVLNGLTNVFQNTIVSSRTFFET